MRAHRCRTRRKGEHVHLKRGDYCDGPGGDTVRKVNPDGTITTFAGTGEYGFSGDGGPATKARLYSPYAVAVDRDGNLYIGDGFNYRVRKVDKDGMITTFAGTGEWGFQPREGAGDQSDAQPALGPVHRRRFGVLYIPDTFNARIRAVHLEGLMSGGDV